VSTRLALRMSHPLAKAGPQTKAIPEGQIEAMDVILGAELGTTTTAIMTQQTLETSRGGTAFTTAEGTSATTRGAYQEAHLRRPDGDSLGDWGITMKRTRGGIATGHAE
jgi:hypothetical protein